jgi:hypothetical protein
MVVQDEVTDADLRCALAANTSDVFILPRHWRIVSKLLKTSKLDTCVLVAASVCAVP